MPDLELEGAGIDLEGAGLEANGLGEIQPMASIPGRIPTVIKTDYPARWENIEMAVLDRSVGFATAMPNAALQYLQFGGFFSPSDIPAGEVIASLSLNLYHHGENAARGSLSYALRKPDGSSAGWSGSGGTDTPSATWLPGGFYFTPGQNDNTPATVSTYFIYVSAPSNATYVDIANVSLTVTTKPAFNTIELGASFSNASSLLADFTRAVPTSSALQAVSNLSATLQAQIQIASSLLSSGTLSADLQRLAVIAVDAALQGNGTLLSDLLRAAETEGSLFGNPFLQAGLDRAVPTSADLFAGAFLTASLERAADLQASFLGTPFLTADLRKALPPIVGPVARIGEAGSSLDIESNTQSLIILGDS